MSKLDGRTLDIEEENIRKMKELFPEIDTDGKIDFEKLREVLGEYVDDKDERYKFTWNGKGEALRISQTPSMGTLRPAPEEGESKDWDNTENLYIEGDNLEVLKLLQKSYFNKIKMIYIDPPYNTGKDFVYTDNYKDNIKNYKKLTGQVDNEGKATTTNPEYSGRYHTDWLNMMYPRLRLARNLLTDDGVIFISIDDNEVHNLRKICDEIFGEDNFIGNIIWQSATDNNPTQIAIEHEYLLCYVKNKKNQNKWSIKSKKAEQITNKYEELKNIHNDLDTVRKELRNWIATHKEELSGTAHYNYVDEIGVYYPGNSSNTKAGGYMYDIIHPITNKVCKKPQYGYRWRKDTFLSAAERGDVEWGESEEVIPKIKKRIDTVTDMLKSYYYEDNRYWSNNLVNLMGGKVFDNPKSLNLIKRIINFTSESDSIILDFFAGSSTTAHAVMDLNAEENGNRKHIMVQLPEETDKKSEAYKVGYETIAEIGKERIRRAGEQIKSELKEKYEKATGEERKTMKNPEELDIGFKVFKLDSSNIKEWNPGKYENIQMAIEDSANPYVEGRTEEDVVYEMILKMGLDLTYPVEKHEIKGKVVYSVGYGLLMICLSEDIDVSVAEKMIEIKEENNQDEFRTIFRDEGFASDTLKTNIKETLKSAGLAEESFITL